jgi:hypothetical protein
LITHTTPMNEATPSASRAQHAIAGPTHAHSRVNNAVTIGTAKPRINIIKYTSSKMENEA